MDQKVNRRQVITWGAGAVTGLFLVGRFGIVRVLAPPASAVGVPGGTLDPMAIPKFSTPLVIPPAMPRTAKLPVKGGKNVDYYEIAVRQLVQQVLPAPLPKTTVWGYGSVNHPATFNYPSFTIEAKWRQPVRVMWVNELKDAVTGGYLPHLLPVDPTLHWANPPGGKAGRDATPEFDATPGPYRGPVPMVTHVHGAHTTDESDGYTEAWYLPAASDIPGEYADRGSFYDAFAAQATAKGYVKPGQPGWQPGTAVFQYPNEQDASTLWYHDHALGMTRLNVYAGPAGFYVLRGGPRDAVLGTLPGPAPALGDGPGLAYHEIPLAIQDRSFNADGSLFYPDTRAFFDGFTGPYIGEAGSDIAPIWQPEFFGNTMLVNGSTWPVLNVEPRRYRFRMLNGCNARFLVLKLVSTDPPALGDEPARPALAFWQIGAEGGFLPAPVRLDQLLMAPAERADVIVDFAGFAPGTELWLANEGPDEPFGGGEPGEDFDIADRATTGQVMKFVVGTSRGPDPSTPPALLVLPARTPQPAATVLRRVLLAEEDSTVLEDVGPRAALLGVVTEHGACAKLWSDPVTERPALGAVEQWEIVNTTADAHPVHIHEIQFEVLGRQAFDLETPGYPATGTARGPEAWETGLKDTVVAYPGEITRVRVRFDLPGLYVWHCHIVEHEDNEMMRPLFVGDPPAAGDPVGAVIAAKGMLAGSPECTEHLPMAKGH